MSEKFTAEEQYIVFRALLSYRSKAIDHGDYEAAEALDSASEKLAASDFIEWGGTPTAIRKAARDLMEGDVLSIGATVTKVDTTTNPGVVYVEGDYNYRFQFNHGDPVKVKVGS